MTNSNLFGEFGDYSIEIPEHGIHGLGTQAACRGFLRNLGYTDDHLRPIDDAWIVTNDLKVLLTHRPSLEASSQVSNREITQEQYQRIIDFVISENPLIQKAMKRFDIIIQTNNSQHKGD